MWNLTISTSISRHIHGWQFIPRSAVNMEALNATGYLVEHEFQSSGELDGGSEADDGIDLAALGAAAGAETTLGQNT